MYASNEKVGFTLCHAINKFGVKASHGVNISTQWAEGNVTSCGSKRGVQLPSPQKKIHEHRNSKAHKEATNILEILKQHYTAFQDCLAG